MIKLEPGEEQQLDRFLLQSRAERARRQHAAMGDYVEELLAWMMTAEVMPQSDRRSFIPTEYYEFAKPEWGIEAADEFGWPKRELDLLRKACPEYASPNILDGITPEIVGPRIHTCIVNRAPAELTNEVYNFVTLHELSQIDCQRWSKRFWKMRLKWGTRNFAYAIEYIDRAGVRRSEVAFIRWTPTLGMQSLSGWQNVPRQNQLDAFNRALTDALDDHYSWHVVLRTNTERSGLLLKTDGWGAEDLLARRDIPEGASRRIALRHWVSEHWRQLRSDPDQEARVREHLRGQSRFTIGTLQCEIRPARHDLDRVASARKKAPERRARR